MDHIGFGKTLLAGTVALALVAGASGRAEATFTFTMEEESFPLVVLNGSGSINLGGLLPYLSDVDFNSEILPHDGFVVVAGVADLYTAIFGPNSFGSGDSSVPLITSGDLLYFYGRGGFLGVPHGYVSDAPLSDSMMFVGTFSSLGVTPGTYVWTWGSGTNADSLTLQIVSPVPEPVPEPASALLVGAGLLGLTAARRLARPTWT